MFFPCGYAPAQRAGISIDGPSLVHPYWLIINHPLWKLALQSGGLADYPEAASALESVSTDLSSKDTVAVDVQRITTEIYDSLGDMEHLGPSERVVNFRQYSSRPEKVVCPSSRKYKIAAAEMISLTNRLSNEKLGSVFVCLRPSATDKTLCRSQNYMLENKSNLVSASASLSQQLTSSVSANKTGGKRRSCTRC